MNSMTGYGQVCIDLPECKVTIEISSVNKKNLEVVVNTPKEWQFFEFAATKFLKKSIHRGRIRVLLTVEYTQNFSELSKALHGEQFNKLVSEIESFFKSKKRNFNLTPESVIELLKISHQESGFFRSSKYEQQLQDGLKKATEAMVGMRKVEGTEIASDFKSRLKVLNDIILQIESESGDWPSVMRQKLLERLKGADLQIDPSDDRVLKELALYAEKCDVSEEITRLKSHLMQFEQTSGLHEPIGRKLEFILQEIGRELNTLCSKSARSQSTSLALDARVEVEKIREQLMNVE